MKTLQTSNKKLACKNPIQESERMETTPADEKSYTKSSATALEGSGTE